MDIYGPEVDTKKPWTEQETLLLLEVRVGVVKTKSVLYYY